MTTENNNQNDSQQVNVSLNNELLSVEAQKQIIDHTMKKSFRYAMKTFAIVFPVMIILVLGILYFVLHVVR